MAGNKERSNSDQGLYRNTKDLLSLLNTPSSRSGFEQAVAGLFGDGQPVDRVVNLGDSKVRYGGSSKDLVALLPIQWEEEFQRLQFRWPGCEKWWAGYPAILLLEVRSSGTGSHPQLRLNAEVGPAADHEARSRLIEAIEATASEMKLNRIGFAAAAKSDRNKYARFLNKNSAPVENPADAQEIRRSIVRLVSSFQPEIEAIAKAIGRSRAAV